MFEEALALTFSNHFRKDFWGAFCWMLKSWFSSRNVQIVYAKVLRGSAAPSGPVSGGGREESFEFTLGKDRFCLWVGWGKDPDRETPSDTVRSILVQLGDMSKKILFPELWGEESPDFVAHRKRLRVLIEEVIGQRVADRDRFNRLDEQFAWNLQDLLEENQVLWELQEFLFDYFNNYLEGKCKPYFFMYQPGTRSFSYRGLLPGNHSRYWWATFPENALRREVIDGKVGPSSIAIHLKDLLGAYVDDTKSVDEFEKRFVQNPVVACVGTDAPDGRLRLANIYVLECIEQPCDDGINRALYLNRSALGTENHQRDLGRLKNTGRSSTVGTLRTHFEEKILKMTQTAKHGSYYLFVPIAWAGQLRGTLFLKGEANRKLVRRLARTSERIADLAGNYIDRVNMDVFRRRVLAPQLHRGRDINDLIVEHLPRLFNTELSGCLTFELPKANTVAPGGKNQEFCPSHVIIYGFSRSGEAYKRLHLGSCPRLACAGNDEAQCLWWEMVNDMLEKRDDSLAVPPLVDDEVNFKYLGFRSRLMPIEKLKNTTYLPGLPGRLDLSQGFDQTGCPTLEASGKEHFKTLLYWATERREVRDKGLKKRMLCFWVALNIPKNSITREEESIELRCRCAVDVLELATRHDEDMKKELLAHRHTILGSIPRAGLDAAHEYFIRGKFAEADEEITKGIGSLKNLEIAFLLALGEEPEGLFRAETLTDIVTLIVEQFSSAIVVVNIPNGPIIIPRNDRVRVFTILWNLMSNADRYDPQFELTIESGERETLITLQNMGIGISQSYTAYLLGGTRDWPNKQRYSGLFFAREAAEYLGWRFTKAQSCGDKTIIQLVIPR